MRYISIRPAIIEDATALSQLICQNAEAMLAPLYTQQQWDIFITYYSVQEMERKLSSQVTFCAELDSQIVGTVALDVDFVVGFYTHVDYLGQGIGSQLMGQLEAYAKANNILQLQLAASPVGLKFYYKHGWKKVRDIIAVHYGVGFEETLMVKGV